eukprot:6944774-Pyramimonas_sp.AAC.1
MADCIIHEFKCQVASKKSQVLASHQALQDQLRSKLGPLAGPNPDRSGPNLGVETGAGRPQRIWRTFRKLTERLDNMRKRLNRVRMLKRAGGNTHK